MGAKLGNDLGKSFGPAPGHYDIPSRMAESPGKTMGKKLDSSLVTGDINVPGPGQYNIEKLKKENYQYTMGARVTDGKNNMNVPGPG
jgi:hypothetical protein